MRNRCLESLRRENKGILEVSIIKPDSFLNLVVSEEAQESLIETSYRLGTEYYNLWNNKASEDLRVYTNCSRGLIQWKRNFGLGG